MARGRLLWGLLLLAIGTVLLVGQLADVDAGAVLAGWWPLAVIVAGLLRLVDRPRDVTGAVLVTGLGLGLLAWRQGLLGELDPGLLAAGGLILAGLVLLVRPPRSRRVVTTGWRPHDDDRERRVHDEDLVEVTAILAERRVTVTAAGFRGGEATAVLGDVDLDLRGASLDPQGAELAVTAVLGDIDVLVPPGWQVTVEGTTVLGDVVDRSVATADPHAPRLTIRATSVLADVVVTTDVVAAGPR